MLYGPFTKQEFYADVLKEWDNPENKYHSNVVWSLLKGKYSWENLKTHYINPLRKDQALWYALYDYHDHFDGSWTYLSRHCDYDMARDISSRIGRLNPAMQNKVTGAVKAMRAKGIYLPRKVNKPEVDFASLRCSG